MATRIYKTPFAATGDKEALATADQPDGKVSLQAGWTPDYELPNDNPNYRPVGRSEMNGVLNEVTEGLGEVQQNGFAKWQAIDGGWPLGAWVSHNSVVYRSTVANNTASPSSGGPEWQPVPSSSGYMLVTQEAAMGVGGGSSVAGTFVTRALNTVRANTIAGASLASSQITLPPGTYRIRAVVPANGVNLHTARFYSVTDGSSVIFGTSENCSSFAATPSETVQTSSHIFGRLVLTSTKVFEVRHICQETVANVGLGSPYAVSTAEVYATLEIVKES
jgi:hypothetical protein